MTRLQGMGSHQSHATGTTTPTPTMPPAADSGLSWSCEECQTGGQATSRFGALYAERLHRARVHGGVLPVTRSTNTITPEGGPR